MDNKLSFKTTPLPTSDSKTYSSLEELVSRVGFLGLSGDVYNDLYKLLPLVRVDQDEQLTDREKLLSSFFRCRHDLNDCSFAADNDDELVDHLSVDHDDQALFCVYCPRDDQDENKHDVSFKNAQELVSHMANRHADMQYQCNLCLFRALSGHHLFVHHALEHTSNFQQTLANATRNGASVDALDLKKALAFTGVQKDLCKILYIQNQNDNPKTEGRALDYLDLFNHLTNADPSEEAAIWHKIIKFQGPILSHTLVEDLKIKKNLNESSISDVQNKLDQITFFRKSLASVVLPRTFDDALMEKIISQLDADQENVPTTKGIKRKLDQPEDIVENEHQNPHSDNASRSSRVFKKLRSVFKFATAATATAAVIGVYHLSTNYGFNHH